MFSSFNVGGKTLLICLFLKKTALKKTVLKKTVLKKTVFSLIMIFLGLPVIFILMALIISQITVNQTQNSSHQTETIYLSTNGVHLDIVLNTSDLSQKLATGLPSKLSNTQPQKVHYYAFGWGDENFYLNAATSADLTMSTVINALLLKSDGLMHVTRFSSIQPDWVAVKLSKKQLMSINQHLQASFATLTQTADKIQIANASYSGYDNFYKANGHYSVIYTCNTWANQIFKKSGLTASYWTPFDFGLLDNYQ